MPPLSPVGVTDGGLLRALGQYGVAVPGGVEIMALAATLGFQEDCIILSFDVANICKSIYLSLSNAPCAGGGSGNPLRHQYLRLEIFEIAVRHG